MPRKTVRVSSPQVVMLSVTALQVDDDIQPRESLSWSVVDEYATHYTEEEEGQNILPPLDVFEIDGNYYVADGFHRLDAARKAKKETLPCHVQQGSKRDAMVFACFANARRGLAYRHGDKERIVQRLLNDAEQSSRSDRDLARDVGVSHVYVWSIRKRLSEQKRLQEELATIPTTTRGPRARAEEQLSTYLDVPHETLKIGLQSQQKHPQEIVYALAKAVETADVTPEEAREKVKAGLIQSARAAARKGVQAQAPRPSRSKESVAQRQVDRAAAQEARARAEAETRERWKRESCAEWFTKPLTHLGEKLYRVLEEKPGQFDSQFGQCPHTLTEMVEAVDEEDIPRITELLERARVTLDAMELAWQERTQQTVTADA